MTNHFSSKRLFVTFYIFCSCLASFATSSDYLKPWTFWYWMYGEVNEDAIVADLKAMKEAGIGGFYLMPIKGKGDIPVGADGKPLYKGEAEQLSPNWWKMIDKVYETSEQLGLQMGIHISDGFALAGGPWINPEESMKRVVYKDSVVTFSGVKAPRTVALGMPNVNEGFYKDIKVLSYPAKFVDERVGKCSVEFPFSAKEPSEIVMSYDGPFTLRSVRVVTGGNNIQAHRWTVFASDNGVEYKEVCKIEPARQGWQNTDAQATYSVPATTAKFFKFHWDNEGSNPGAEDMDAAKWKPNLKIADLQLSSEPIVDGFEGKSAVAWRVSKEKSYGNADCIGMDEIVDLTEYCEDGVFDINNVKDKALKKKLKNGGLWHVVRIGYTSTGHKNATAGGGKGLECDKFDKLAVRKQFDNWFARIYKRGEKATPNSAPRLTIETATEEQQALERRLGTAKNKVLTRLHVDSWECGSQNWSENFADEFKARRGYDLNDWLLLYAGVPVESVEKSDAVLRDIRTTIGELISDVFFTVAKDCAKEYGVELSTECVAPTMISDGLMHYKHADIPMGEFWLNSPTHDKINDMLDAISGAHIYGKNIIQAEGFTEVRGTWDEHPAMLKALLDRNFCYGINSIVFHVMTHNPYLDKKPGMTLDGIGTFFQRDNTWWREMPAFTDYIQRCQKLLQSGRPVVDIAVYTGDEMPRRSIIPNRLVDVLPGLFGEKYVAQEHARMANVGLPMEVSPVGVNHTKNMVKADDFINPLHGYKYDSFNHDVLKTATVVDGKIRTAYGMEYAVLVVPQARPMNPNNINTAKEDIERLRAQGAKILETPWVESTLESLGVKQDIVLPDGLDYAHRTSDGRDVYFISNQTDKEIAFCIDDLKIRSAKKHVYLYDMVTNGGGCLQESMYGEMIKMAAGDSRFIVLSDDVDWAAPNSAAERYGEGVGITLVDLSANDWTIEFAENGKVLQVNELMSWDSYDEPEVKYYSGHAIYTTEFNYNLPKKKTAKNAALDAKEKIQVSLENVNNIASVTVNGKQCGTAWRAPYTIDITDAIQKGKNKIEISVVNTWANALLGNDLGTPPFLGIWTNGKYRRAEKTTLPAGLTGSVRIEKVTMSH